MKLELELLRLLGNGTLYAKDVQTLAQAAWEDGWGLESGLAFRLRDSQTQGDAQGVVAYAWAADAWEVSEASKHTGALSPCGQTKNKKKHKQTIMNIIIMRPGSSE